MFKIILWVAALGLCCSSIASAAGRGCDTDFAKVRQDLSAVDDISEDKKEQLLDRLDKAREHCEKGNAEKAHKHLEEIESDEIYAEVFDRADEH